MVVFAVSLFVRAKNTLILFRLTQGLTTVSTAHAGESKTKTTKTAKTDKTKIARGKQLLPATQGKDPAAELTAEKKALALEREQLRQEEERLKILKKDIETKLQALKALENKVGKLLKKRDEREEKRLEQLASVFESTPPEQAGPLFSKLDIKTAAAILYRMNGRKAGKIWGFVNADRAVKISEELTRLKEIK